MIGDRTYPWAHRVSLGTLKRKGLYEHTFGYTETRREVDAASTTAVHAAVTLAAAGGTIASSFTNPDVPRAISVTTGGTTANIRAGIVEVHGTNVEGQVIHEELALTDNQNGTTSGVKAFKTVTSVDYPPMDGAAATLSVGILNKLGINHRLPSSTVEATVKVFSSTTPTGALTLQAAPTVVADEADVELNTVTPATSPDGTTSLIICYEFDDWATSRDNDNPNYWDATTTSTSTTTATTTTTSTSSTSSSTSSTSSSTSSTSSSTSSTSTSTTTVV